MGVHRGADADERVKDILSNLQVNIPVQLVNESNMDWGE